MKCRRSLLTLALLVPGGQFVGARIADREIPRQNAAASATAKLDALTDASAAALPVHPCEDRLNQGFSAGHNPLTGTSPTVDCALTNEAARCKGGECKQRWTLPSAALGELP